jgi:ssDNA-binding replication factor A large subunit
MSDHPYGDHVALVLESCPDASEEDIVKAFKQYEEEFFIPPQDAMHSIIRKLQVSSTPTSTGRSASGGSTRTAKPMRKVERLEELTGEDQNVEITVQLVSHNVREQTVRGEQRTIAFGLLEDQPYDSATPSTRWEYKDWAPKTELRAGSIVRLEGASVNEYQGRRSINVNRSTRVVVLEEGTAPVVAPGEPLSIANLPKEGNVCVVGRILGIRPDVIHRRDGTGSIDVVRGRLADDTGSIGFLSWEPLELDVGQLVKIDGANVRTFRDTPELNFGRTTTIEAYHDAAFASTEDLEAAAAATIADLRDGARDVRCVVEIHEWQRRTFTRDGEERHLWSGQVADPSGRCRMSAWDELPIDESSLPVTVRLTGVRVRAWQGVPDITVDSADQVEVLDGPPWEERIDFATHSVEVDFDELAEGGGRVGVSTTGLIVSIRDDSGLIQRCPECRRVLRDGACQDHGPQDGQEDVRLRLVMQGERSTISVFLGRDPALALLGMDLDALRSAIAEHGAMAWVQTLRARFLGRSATVRGRLLVDERSSMFMAEALEPVDEDGAMMATEARAQWEVA